MFDWTACPYVLALKSKDLERKRRMTLQKFTLKTREGVEEAMSAMWKEQKKTKSWCILRIHPVSRTKSHNYTCPVTRKLERTEKFVEAVLR